MAILDRLRYFERRKATTPLGYNHVRTESNPPSDGNRSSTEDGTSDGLLEKGGMQPDFPIYHRLALWQRPQNLIIGGFAFLVIYTAILLSVTKRTFYLRDSGLPWSPAIEALEFRNQKFSLEDRIQEHGSFSGQPNADLDKAWHDLLNAENIIIEPEYMRRYQREDLGVAVPEGGGYLGTLNVYHELHCLKRLHQYMYPEYYFPDLNEHQLEMNRLHNEHCIDFLRQAAMCHGDIGLITYEWHDDSLIPVANATSHQCVNWEKLDTWTKERTVDMMKPGWLIHPIFGVAYPDGEGDKIGAVDPHGVVVSGHMGGHH